MNSKNFHKKKEESNVESRNNNKNIIKLNLIIVFLTFIFFFPSLLCDFVTWDDEGYIINNLRNIGDFSFSGIFKLFGDKVIMGNYHPFTITIYSLIYAIFKFSPFAYHFFNVLIHILNSLLVFWFIYQLRNKNQSDSNNKIFGFERNLVIPFIVALLFGIHPLHVETVTWISETKDVLYTCFYLSGLLTYINYIESNRKTKYLVYTSLFFILSCFSKGQAVTFPLILILIDYLKNEKLTITKQLNKIHLFVIALIFGIIAIKSQTASEAVQNMEQYNIIDKIMFPFYAASFYIVKMLLPFNLSIIYPYPEKVSSFLPVEYYLAPIFILIISIIVFRSLRKSKIYIFSYLFYIFVILPVLQIKPVGESLTADRYFYLSSIGIFLIIAYGFDYLYFTSNLTVKNKKGVLLLFIVISLYFGMITFQRTKVWTNSQTLWESVIQSNPKIDKAYYGIGVYLERKNNKQEALKYYKKTVSVNPKNYKALNNIGNLHYLNKNMDSAYIYYNASVKVNPKFPEGYYNLGNIYYLKNSTENAVLFYTKSIEFDNKNAEAWYMLGVCYSVLKDNTKSKDCYKKAAQLGLLNAKKKLINENKKNIKNYK